MSEQHPDHLRYTAEHEWVRDNGDGTIRFGITFHAQDALGDIVFVTLPQVDAALTAGEACGEVESTKSVSDIFAPVSGTVVARNEAVETSPELLNSDPYEGGWIADVRLGDGGLPELMDAVGYEASFDG